MFNGVAMCCRDVVFVLWVRCWILSCCLNVQWCGHVLWRCDVNAMGTVLDFELLSLCSMVWPCDVRVMGTVLDFDL